MSDTLWGNYGGPGGDILGITASTDCSSITPEDSQGNQNMAAQYVKEEDLPQGRTMGQFIHLPDGTMVISTAPRREPPVTPTPPTTAPSTTARPSTPKVLRRTLRTCPSSTTPPSRKESVSPTRASALPPSPDSTTRAPCCCPMARSWSPAPTRTRTSRSTCPPAPPLRPSTPPTRLRSGTPPTGDSRSLRLRACPPPSSTVAAPSTSPLMALSWVRRPTPRLPTPSLPSSAPASPRTP